MLSFMITKTGQMKNIAKIIASEKTVFTISDIQKLLHIDNYGYARLLLHRWKKSSIVKNPYAGIFTLPKYDMYEFASKLQPWSYISFETVLQNAGIIFQDYEHTIMLAGNDTMQKKIGDTTYVYHKIKDGILYNPLGIENHDNKYMIASPERAVCDMIYLYKNIYFDNVRDLSKEKLETIKQIYPKATILLINNLIQHV